MKKKNQLMHFFQKTIRPSLSAWAYIFFLSLIGYTTHRLPHSSGNKMTCCLFIPKIRLGGYYGGRKNSLLFFCLETHFQPVFCSKHLGNPLKTLLNQYLFMENIKNRPKTRNPPENIKTSLA